MSNDNKKFVHLHLHSQYSLLEGAIHIKKLAEFLKKFEMPACAITDHGNLHGAIEFYKTMHTAGIKPLIGQGFWLKSIIDKQKSYYKINLICLDFGGYQNLIKLSSLSYQKSSKSIPPHINQQLLSTYKQGLIAILPGSESELWELLRTSMLDEAKYMCSFLAEHFSENFYVEIFPNHEERISDDNKILYKYAQQQNISAFISNNCFYLKQDDAYAQHVLELIGQKEKIDQQQEQKIVNFRFLKTYEQLYNQYKAWGPKLLDETVAIAYKCELSLDNKKFYLPKFQPPKSQNLKDYFIQEAQRGLQKKIFTPIKSEKLTDQKQEKISFYQQRLDAEIKVITDMGYIGYYMIVADIVSWAKQNGVLVGPGRGSGAGSLVAYALDITDIDPVKFDLLFERFLNPDRISLPDFDIDFDTIGREKVINYCRQKYGQERVSHISAIGTLQAKAVLRNVGRALNIEYKKVDRIAKLIPNRLGIDLQSALSESDELKTTVESTAENRQLFDIALKLEGLNSNLSTHAAGLVIMDTDISLRLPLCKNATSHYWQTQYPMEHVESQGAVKFDFLGLNNLTIIGECLKLIAANNKQVPKLDNLDLEDPLPYKIISRGLTCGIFQLESAGMKSFIQAFTPSSFEELISLVGIYRPGPLQSGMAKDFIQRKKGQKKLEYWHPLLEPILKNTFGVIIYQEQVMRIAQKLAGFSLAEADILRRAMGKKKAKELRKLKDKFISGCQEKNDITKELAINIFELIQNFAGYGFNKSHSAAYGLISFQTAYLKCYYTTEFMAALLSMHNDDQQYINNIAKELKVFNIDLVAPNVNQSNVNFLPTTDNKIIYGLRAIKNLGYLAATSIVDNRSTKGTYKNLDDFLFRQDYTIINARGIEALIYSGALESLESNRNLLISNIADIKDQISSLDKKGPVDQLSIFDKNDQHFTGKISLTKPPAKIDALELYQHEKNLLGTSFSRGPLQLYSAELNRLQNKYTTAINEIIENMIIANNNQNGYKSNGKEVLIAGALDQVKYRNNNNKYYALLKVEDNSAAIDCWLYDPQLHKYHHLLEINSAVLLECAIRLGDMVPRIHVFKIISLQKFREVNCQSVILKFDPLNSIILEEISQLAEKYPGETDLIIEYQNDAEKIAARYLYKKVSVEHNFCRQLSQTLPSSSIIYEYSPHRLNFEQTYYA